MKSIYLLSFSLVLGLLFISPKSFGQAPEAINYQAVARDASGNLLSNQSVSFRLTIRQGSPSGMAVYAETHSKTTNQFGIVTMIIGGGTALLGNFSTIDWGGNEYFLQTEMDPAGGTSYSLMGTSQFFSVPYALYSKTSGNALPAGDAGQTLRSDGTSWIPNSTIYNEGFRVGVGTSNPDNSAMLDVYSVDKGFLPPRMTQVEMNAIPNPAAGLIVFCNDCGANGTGVAVVFMNGTWNILAISCTLPNSPLSGTQVPSATQITWNWTAVPGATGYKWNTINNYAGATDMLTATTKTETGLTCNTVYTRYAWAYNTCGSSAPVGLTQTTLLTTPSAPTAGTHVPSATQIVWNWNTVSGAIGYKWNTTNDYGTATDMLTVTTKTETGLTCNTGYTRYAWAYSACGNSTPVTLSQTTSLYPPAIPTAGTHVPSATQIIWNWNSVSGATGYKWSINNIYASATDMGTTTTKTETGLTCNTPYMRYAWAYSACGNSTPVTLTQTTSLNPPAAPTAGTHVPSATQIVWNWNSVSGATGYKWNTTNNYATATDMLTITTKTETGLTCNTGYSRYAWAYSACGNSTPVTLSQTTSLNPPAAPTAGTHVPSATQIVWNWNSVSGATGYKWNTTNNYATATDMLTATTKTETGLTCNTGYTRYAWAYSACGNSTSVTLTQTTSLNPPAAPTAGTHVPSATQIVWNWNSVSGATGYKWNTTNNYATATDMLTATMKTETGLTCNTGYTRYAWAYSACGNSTPVTLTQTTSLNPPAAPTAGTHVPSATQIVWNWNTVSGATGYKWNTTNDYGTATDMLTATIKTETGLTCNTGYTRYAWAYSACGNSTPVTLTQTTSLNPPAAPTAGTHVPSSTQIVWNWNTVSGATGYKWNTTNDYGTATDMLTATTKTETGLTCNTGYTRYAWAYSACGNSTPVTLTQTTSLNPPAAPTAGTHVPSATQIVWNWNTVPNATGYKWNNVDDFESAEDVGNNTTFTEADLTCNTEYTRYAWAYNSCGNSSGTTLTVTTSSCGPFSCGQSITVNHVAGTIAPVTKTVTYGTVINIPGEPSKCWITSNLGADHQATAVSDATEASAGWYWQFNLKQGYKHDGTTRTPSTSWITTISENLDWQTANDPCALELGSGWRIPAYSEWNNIFTTGGWTNWWGPWNSLLKIHAGGTLQFSDGTLNGRGIQGDRWSSTQINNTLGWHLGFTSGNCYMGTNTSKAHGFNIRCIKDTCSSTPTAPASGTHVPSPNQVIWNWNTVPGATGYKWNTTNDYATATNMGTATTKTETGLNPGTAYTRYVWAYNTCYTSAAITLTQSTSAWSCGSSFIANHVTGTVAPVTKTVTYGTVINIPGEPSKCWITSNLGADHQATAVSDATEASAGWYWQFNRKQGYKHDGSTRTPNTTWITSINENLEWQTANDPCALELGTGWRIPTSTEWTNVDASGNWTNWNGPWGSGLKLHAAGYLVNSDGSLNYRGSYGDYWSSTQKDAANGWNIATGSGFSTMGNGPKAYGFSLRCIKDTCTSTPNAPTSGTHVPSPNQVIWNWNTVPGATGYKWNTTNDYATATNMGTATTKTETGLNPGTAYTRYVWAYNTCFASAVTTLTQSTSAWSCTSSFIINHVVNTVAPINKTVTYGTVINVPGEPSKCWITSNLGADRQATAVSDATEASAGWYWQFNRKQGYKHDGTTRTPNTTWITTISENLDWQTANDPCVLELGSGWRIPTKTEWTNVDASGNWTNWNGPWNSLLKIHAAGSLNYTSGSSQYRGSDGNYWSSTQGSNTYGYYLYLSNSGYSYVDNWWKTDGFAIRCVKDTCTSTPNAPASGTHVPSPNQVIWNWNTVSGATGYKWNTINDYGTATDMSTATTKTETGLNPGTAYSRYVWAYNTCFASAATTLTQSTSAWSCGSSFTINHVENTVAPVAKTVYYGTVINIPGEPSKCWITRNLGADRQGTAVNDATEPSAGWYWQFNRKQGYKHDGTTRTPNTTWINPITENIDWQTANDPCVLELGSGWRIPTKTEWTNVDASGNWTTWDGPWNSGLKIHMAGYLINTSGSLTVRGVDNYQWAGTGSSLIYGWGLDIGSADCYINDHLRAHAFSVRCIKDTCTSTPNAPASGTHVPSPNQVIWNWNTIPGAAGYKWSTTNDYATATNMGTATTKTETGLNPGTVFTRYVWSYNTCFASAATTLTHSTSAWSCGSSFIANHAAGAIAPVTKTVTYGTVISIPGEPSKCWITSNLGADHQATAVSDATEASAGWYWQFNRKQGYKHDGSTRTPNTTWITSINENLEWQTANDPCALELGTGWRIPTSTEWTNVDASGNWTNWNGPWGSGLKLHAAGLVSGIDGSLWDRGSIGYNWSSTQDNATNGWLMRFSSGVSYMSNDDKAYTFSMRCIKDTCSSSPNAPTSGTHSPSQTQIVWNWNTVTGATGFKWNTTNDYATATNMGTATTKTETGLNPGTAYTRYVWAYNTCFFSAAATLTQSTSAWNCGSSLITNHIAGTVAPVTKTVAYGTVINIPGEPSKCWITSNLGADRQATAVNDATEASAGWYWQFNRKQGYKHDGTTRTPNTTWITTISENLDWQTADDPCTLELGTGWRIPTATEWANVDASGNWTNWNGPWNSGLKMHAAGHLRASDGSLFNRGTSGHYRSSMQLNTTNGQYLYFYSSGSVVGYDLKEYGFSLRCIKDTCSSTPNAPASGTHVPSPNQVIWNWNPVSGAIGYKWNTTNDYATATNMGTATTKTETGLNPGTAYTRYVWAYNTCFASAAATLTQSTSAWSCGASFLKNHSAGTVSPVTKTVAYGTVINIPGEPSKCWITSNLGADHQATAVSDATEASAGWYWQFNRKQGYKHDGTTRTPNTSWITSINENLDWQTSNDPCTLELGTGWRIPTSTEWTNVDASGNWTNWNGPWTSGLKMHGAGFLGSSNGSLTNRGSYGDYGSSTQNNSTTGWDFNFDSGNSFMSNSLKVNGFPLRCINDACSSGPNAPTSGTHSPSQTQIVWNWNTVTGATGFKWNTTNDYGTAADMGTAATKTETGLSCNTSYSRYVWAYNPCGYSPVVSMTQLTSDCNWVCGQSITDARDNQVYSTVLIDSQCWMKQNLNVGARINTAQESINNSITEKYCNNDNESNCAVYGGLYQWGEMVQYLNGASNSTSWDPVPAGNVQGICPAGWHLPTDEAWTTLTTYLGGTAVAGGKIKEAGYVHWVAPNTGATNSSGFTALGGGNRDYGGYYYSTTQTGVFWSATNYSGDHAWYYSLAYYLERIDRLHTSKYDAFSVRCIKD